MRKIAVVVRGPTAVGKSTVVLAIQTACSGRGEPFKTVSLDDGWMPTELRYVNTDPARRYADLVGAVEPVLIVELAWGEPFGSGFGATRNPTEWSLLLKAERDVYLIRLSGERSELSRRRFARDSEQYGRVEEEIYRYVETDAGTDRFCAKTGLDELVIPIDGRSKADIGGAALRFLRSAFDD